MTGAYQTARKILIAQNLNLTTLAGSPTAFENTLSAQQRSQFLTDLHKVGLTKNGATTSSRGMVMSFAPGTTQLIGKVIKARGGGSSGNMSAYAATSSNGQPILDVHVNYIFAYAVEPPGNPAEWTRVTDHVDGIIQFGDFDGIGTFVPWVYTALPFTFNVLCSEADGYVHPEYPALTASPQPTPSGPVLNPYDFNAVNNTGTCERSGRT